jgi:MFS family permease
LHRAKKNVAVLATLQALLFTNNSTVISLNGLAGYQLAPDKALATVPVTGWVIGAALTTFLASMLMKRIGRRGGFTVGTICGMVGALICCLALYLHNFWLFVAGTSVFGIYNAFGQYYRFAAADAAPDDWRAKAISYVLAGGLVGGIIGPTLSRVTKDMLDTQFLGAYLTLFAFLGLVLVVLRKLDMPMPSAAEALDPGRPLTEIAAQPAFIVAVMAAAVSYGVMNLLMTATPLAMGVCGHPYSAAAMVISSHVIGMFAPSFFTGSLIQRFGVLQVMFVGVIINGICIAIALAGVEIINFWAALVLLGVGWNFMYVGGTTLLTEAYRPAEKAKTQGANEILVFCTTATSSFASGVLVNAAGWNTLNYVALPFLVIAGSAALWLAMKRRAATAAA